MSTHLNWTTVFKKILLEDEGLDSCNNSDTKELLVGCNPDFEISFDSKRIISETMLEPQKQLSCKVLTPRNTGIKLSESPSSSFNKQTDKPFSIEKGQNRLVPEWNKVFKSILLKDTSENVSNQEKSDYLLKKDDILSKPEKKYRARRKPPRHISDEEKKINEIFDRARTFKKVTIEYNINDFDGSGVNIFKYRKEMESVKLSSKTYPEDSQPMKCVLHARSKTYQTRYS